MITHHVIYLDNLSLNSTSNGLSIGPNVKIMIGSNLSIRIDNSFLSVKEESDERRIVFTSFDRHYRGKESHF